MRFTRQQLAEALVHMNLDDIKDIRHEELLRQEREQQRKAAARLNDQHGTVRYDSENDLFLVRQDDPYDEEPYWTVYLRERHGDGVYDTEINPDKMPIIASLPPRKAT